VPLREFIGALEKAAGRKAILDPQPMQAGDIPATYADVGDLRAAIGFEPRTPLEEGVGRFMEWFLEYYKDGERLG
jgi:UDP-glucuronate 4-epimerase